MIINESMFERIGQLNCLRRSGSVDGAYVILLHGFGADAADLFPLAQILDPDRYWTFITPEAPLEVPIGPGWTGRGWFPISLRDLETGIDFTQIRPPGLDSSRQMVEEMIKRLEPSTLVLGGFSQGAMVSMDLAMHNPEALQGLLLYSGVLLDQPNWEKRAENLRGLRFLQTHGRHDQVLPYSAGQRLYEILKKAGANGEFFSFAGGHEIPMAALKKSEEFLAEYKINR